MTITPTLAVVSNSGGFPKAFSPKLGANAIEFDHSTTTVGSGLSDNYLWGAISPAIPAANFAGDYTVAFWWNRKAISGTENQGICFAVFIAGDGTGPAGAVEGDIAIGIRYATSVNGFSCTWTNRTNSTTSAAKTATFSSKTPAIDTWTHVVLRYKKIDATTGSMELFFNGVSQQILSGAAQVANTIGVFTPTNMKVYIGRTPFDANPATGPLAARMDRLRVYNNALSNFAIGILAGQT